LWPVAPTTRGLIGDPRAAPALKGISAIHDSDEYEDQPFVILESVEVSQEPRIDPEDISCRTKTVAGYAVGITSYRLGSTYSPKAEIHLPGADARLAAAEDKSEITPFHHCNMDGCELQWGQQHEYFVLGSGGIFHSNEDMEKLSKCPTTGHWYLFLGLYSRSVSDLPDARSKSHIQ